MIMLAGVRKKLGFIEVLRGVDLHVARTEVCGLVGPSGVGKTTLVKILAGFLKMDNGLGLVNGWDLSKIAHPGDLHIGYVPQDIRLSPWLTGLETLEYLAAGGQNPQPKHRAREMLAWSGLDQSRDRWVRDYDGAQRRQLALAAAMLHNPQLVLLDDPLNGVSDEKCQHVIGLTTDLSRQGKTVLIAARQADHLVKLCDSILVLSQGVVTREVSHKT